MAANKAALDSMNERAGADGQEGTNRRHGQHRCQGPAKRGRDEEGRAGRSEAGMSSRFQIDELRQRLAQMPAESRTPGDCDTAYRELIGIVPPLLREPGKESLAAPLRGLHDRMLAAGSISQGMEARAAHLTLLAMMLMNHSAGALTQAIAARRAGASWDDLHHMVDLAFLLFGLPAADRGEELLTALAQWEQQDRIEGAVAAYG